MSFSHGGDVLGFAEAYGYRVDEVIDLSSNINFIKPSIDIDFNALNISSYPNYTELLEAISQNYGCSSEAIELYNGATSAIYSLFRSLDIDTRLFAKLGTDGFLKESARHKSLAFFGTKVSDSEEFCKKNTINLYAPIYLEYKRCAILHGYQINYINRFENLYQDIAPNSLVVFVNPSTPDGMFYDIDRLMQLWIKRGATIVLDESFLDFTNFQSAISYLGSYDRLYIIKSMTKFYSSAGIRVGCVISSEQNIKRLKKSEPIWKISEFDSQYLQSALRDREFRVKSLETNSKNRAKTIEVLKRSSYIDEVYPSSANFVLVRLKDITAKEFQEMLIPHKIMIRDCFNFDFLDNRFVRIAIKDKNAIEKLKEALCESSI